MAYLAATGAEPSGLFPVFTMINLPDAILVDTRFRRLSRELTFSGNMCSPRVQAHSGHHDLRLGNLLEHIRSIHPDLDAEEGLSTH
jgi:hypothetical protein